MDSGQVSLTDFQSLLAGRNDAGSLLAVAGPTAGGVAPLWQADVIFGPAEVRRPERVWAYETCTFVSTMLPALVLADVAASGAPQRLGVGPLSLQLEFQPHCNFQRKPSLPAHDQLALPWPSVVYSTSLVQPQQQFQAPLGFLVGSDSPAFAAFSAAFNAFFYGNYALTGSNNPPLGQMAVRLCDQRGRITAVSIGPTMLTVATEGEWHDRSRLELMATEDRAVVETSGTVATEVPLPHGLPDDAWLWLRSDHEWLDYRSLGGWASHRSPDVRDERSAELVVDLAALIAQGENQHVEFKGALPTNTAASRRTALKTIVAFANGDGGVMLYGVSDDGTVPGLVDADARTVDGFLDVLRASTAPMPECRCSLQQHDDKTVLVVDVAGNTGTIHALTAEANKPEFFVRRGATTFLARAEELQVVAQRHKAEPYP